MATKKKVPAKRKKPGVRREGADIVGNGWRLVNLKTLNSAKLVVNSKVVAAWLYHWDPEVFSWSTQHEVARGKEVSVPLYLVFASGHDMTVGDDADFLLMAKELARLKSDRVASFSKKLEAGEPLEFEVLVEALKTHIGKIGFFTSNSLVRAGEISDVGYKTSWGRTWVEVEYQAFLWNNGQLIRHEGKHSVGMYDQASTLDQIGVALSVSETEKARLVTRGRRIIDLCQKTAHVYLEGNIDRKEWWAWEPFASTGRAIVDPMGAKLIRPRETFTDLSLDEDRRPTEVILDSENQMVAVDPHVAVFSFTSKKWGRASVEQLSDVAYRDDAFNNLVMPQEDKELVLCLVENSTVGATAPSDFIDGKSGGSVLLLHGSPGVGKTLTAEAVAEMLHRPLYSISVGELGTNPDALETKLGQVLQTAERWNAVLLLDEADVFFERRQRGDIHRNAMVSVFLRLLEYYRGVLILTTNRVEDMDIAFYSRISLPLYYEAFDVTRRELVTNNLLALFHGVELDETSIRQIAIADVNGRQIKNSLRLAKALAKKEKRAVTGDDVLRTLNKMRAFQDRMRGNATSGAPRADDKEDVGSEAPASPTTTHFASRFFTESAQSLGSDDFTIVPGTPIDL